MKLKIVAVFLVLAFQNLYGQNNETTKSNQFFDPLKNKTHWGINTQFVFDRLFQSSTTPVEIIYKRQKKANKANRVGLQLYYDHDNERPYPVANPGWNTIETDLIAGFFFGKETQNFIGNSPRWQWFYGTDINLIFTYNRRYIADPNTSGLREHDDTKYYKYGVAIKPFIGLRFEITPRIYVSTDMLASVQYEFQDMHVELKSVPNVVPEFTRYRIDNQFWQLKFYPLTRLSVFIKL